MSSQKWETNQSEPKHSDMYRWDLSSTEDVKIRPWNRGVCHILVALERVPGTFTKEMIIELHPVGAELQMGGEKVLQDSLGEWVGDLAQW